MYRVDLRRTTSGYSSYVEYHVSPNQWAEILKIL